jgi:hypothetical protein
MDEPRIDGIPQVFDEENGLLATRHSKRPIFQIEHSKALGSDGF